MKNNKILIIVGVVLLNILVVFMIGQNLMGKPSEYELALDEARALSEKELCSRSIEKYEEALSYEDTLEIRLEMLKVYELGIEIGEFEGNYSLFSEVTDSVEAFREEPRIYEAVCRMLMKYGKYEECAELLMQARDLHVTSEVIEEYREQVRYLYRKYYAMYTEVLPTFNGMYTVKTEYSYAFLSDTASPELDGDYLEASSFSEGYAFVVCPHPDGNNRSIIINKDGQRQVYLQGVESSSGVGKAKDREGEAIYLLSCKVGQRYTYYNVAGEQVFGDYFFAGRFRNNVAAVMEEEGKWLLINGAGKVITDTVFSDVVLNEFDECAAKGYILAKSGNQYHIYDLSGNQVGDFGCDGAKAFVDSYAAFQKDGLWGFVDMSGNVVIEPQYEDAKSFSNGIGAVLIGQGWVFVNAENDVVIQETFEDVDYLNDQGICFVKQDGYWSYLKMYYTGE